MTVGDEVKFIDYSTLPSSTFDSSYASGLAEKIVLYYLDARNHIKLANQSSGTVALLKLHYDIEPELVSSFCVRADVIVVECYGSGRVPPKLLPVLDNLNEKTPVLTTRVPG